MKWIDAVKSVYSKNKHRAGYKLKDAMKDAKKLYRTSKNAVMKGSASKKTRKNKNM